MSRKKVGWHPVFLFWVLGTLLCLGTCGLEDYPFIDPVPQSNIIPVMNYRATVRIPSSNSAMFEHFAIFYRIYVSNELISSTTRDNYSAINSYLASDYNSIFPYIDSDTLVNTNMDTLFQGRGYKYLSLENGNIDAVLSSSALGSTLVFDFPASASAGMPTMTIGSSVYTLWRSNGSGTFTPRPDRNLVNNNDLWNSDYINQQFNADVVDKSGIGAGDRRYTYTAMFIVAVGIDANTYSYIYSTPSLIHVFQLPDP